MVNPADCLRERLRQHAIEHNDFGKFTHSSTDVDGGWLATSNADDDNLLSFYNLTTRECERLIWCYDEMQMAKRHSIGG